MSIFNAETPEEGILLEENVVPIPLTLFEQLIRAETERDILEATIEKDKYNADTVMQAIITARNSYVANRCRCIQPHVGKGFGVLEPTEDVSKDA